MVTSAKRPWMAWLFVMLLAFFVAGCGKYDMLERNMQYVSIEVLRKESVVAYERLAAAHAAWKSAPQDDTLKRFKNFYLQYSIVYNELVDRSGARPAHHLSSFDTTMPSPPPGVSMPTPETAVPGKAVPVDKESDATSTPASAPARTTSAPPADTTHPAAAASPASPPPAETAYLVQSGDTPHSIARQLKVSEADLMRVNNITAPRNLQVGQRLVIPGN